MGGFFYLCIVFFRSVWSLSLCFVHASIIFFLRHRVNFFYFRACRFFIDTVSMVVCAIIHVWLSYGYVTVAYLQIVLWLFFIFLLCFVFGRVVFLFVLWCSYPL